MNPSSCGTVFVVCAVVLIAGVLATQATASIVGTNAVLDANDWQFYIPLESSTSGVLGDPLNGNKLVGLQQDHVTFNHNKTQSSGYVSMLLTFDLSSVLAEGQQLDPNSTALALAFEDLDFKPVTASGLTFRESLDLSFLPDAEDPATTEVDLTLDQSNYGLFRDDGFGETNDASSTYTFNLSGDLGVNQTEFADINADKEFGVLLTFHSHLAYAGHRAEQFRNDPEPIAASLQLATVPEPAVLVLLLAGATSWMMRR